MGKIFEALQKKADPIAAQVLNPPAIDSPVAVAPVPAAGGALESALAAVLAGTSEESKEAAAETPVEPPHVSAESEAGDSPSPSAEMRPLDSTSLASGADGTEFEPSAAPSPTSQLPGLDAQDAKLFHMAPIPASAPVANGVTSVTRVQTLGAKTVPIRVPGGDPLLPFDAAPTRASEQYRYLRTKLVQDPRQPRSILISSPGPGDGKTVTAVNLTGALSLKCAADVVLVDGDLRRASVHKHLGIARSPGLVDVLLGKCALEEVLIHAEQFPNLFLIPAGESSQNPAELLDSAAWTAIAEKLRATFKYVVIDSPPVASVADYHLIEPLCDGVVLVVRPDHTDRTLTMKALEIVPKEKFMGLVVNCAQDWFLTKHTYYNYAYDYLTPERPAKDSKN